MKIVILEGIATSGKTSVRKEFEKILETKNLKYIFVDESETLMPVLYNTDPKVSLEYLKQILEKYINQPADILIFDRFYLTHLWKTGGDIHFFEELAQLLKKQEVLLLYLKIPKETIQERIQGAMSHRDEKWNEYVRAKGKNMAEITNYYTNQQKQLLDLLIQISIPYQVFDTADLDFKGIAEKLYLIL